MCGCEPVNGAYGELPEHLKESAEKMCKGKTIEDLRLLSNYFSKKSSDMSRELEKSVTMEDFEKIKKSDDADSVREGY